MFRQNLSLLVTTIIVVLFVFLGQGVKIYTDWLWYLEIGEVQFFLRYLLYQWGMAIGIFLVVLSIAGGNLIIARNSAPSRVQILEGGLLEIPLAALSPLVTPVLWGIVFFLAIAAGSSGYINWQLPMLFFNWTSFGTQDPVFHKDLSFYVFRLPYLGFFYQWIMIALISSLILCGIVYVFARGIKVTLEGVRIFPRVLIHLSILLSFILIVRGLGYLFTMYELLYSSHGVIWGPGYTDFNAKIPLQKILCLVALLGGTITLFNIGIKSWKIPIGVFFIWGIISLIGVAYPNFVQQFKVIPNELALEESFIRNHIAMTRQAYQLDKVEVKRFIPKNILTANSLKEEEGILKNIRLWDHQPLLTTYAQLQEIRPYYKFLDVDIDRYTINGKFKQVMLSPRELSYEHLPSKSWVNEHLVYTHGYGLVLSAVNQISQEGLPEFLIKDIPPAGNTDIKIDRPEIYFGELSNSYVVVNTRQQEFDYPSGDENKYTHYNGNGGVSINNFWRKLIFSIRFSTLKLMLSADLTSNSRIMYYRPLKERLTRAFPLLIYDDDPYLIIHDGKLFWIADAYTITSNFPYSAPIPFTVRNGGSKWNYLRNAAKVVVDAYNGTVKFYLSDPSDPIIQSYNKLFPGLFHDLSELPLGIRTHLRYPEDLFKVQTEMYATFHMKDPRVFYNKEDIWHFSRTADGRETSLEPYYAVMKFPQSPKEEFIQMVPLTPAKKDNLSAWIAARSDPANYGQLIAYIFPKQELVFGPMQIAARINQDPAISQLLTLWGQQGSSVIRGQLQVIPIGSSLLYVQPLYLKSERGQLPELKRVIVAYGANIAMEETLEEALIKIFGKESTKESTEAIKSMTATKKEGKAPLSETTGQPEFTLLGKAREHYDNAIKFQREGNWAKYGEEIRKLGEVLESIEKGKTKQ